MTSTDVDFALVRYNTDGSLDTTFDADGKVTTDFALENDAIVELAIQDDGKIVAVGHATEAGVLKASVARYNTDGTLDTTFSTDGKVASLVSSGGAYAEARAVAIQPDGKIVVGGGGEGSADEDFAVFRYNTDGTLDTTFAGDGKKNVDFGDWELAYSVAVQTDGRIVAAGYTVFAHDFALLRMEADGRLDSTYGVGGLVTVDLGGNESYMDAALQSDDKLVGVGLSSSVSTTAFAVGRHLAS